MFKLYLKKKITDVTAWIGIAIILSAIFLPRSVTMGLGLYLVITPDAKLNEMISNWATKVKKQLGE